MVGLELINPTSIEVISSSDSLPGQPTTFVPPALLWHRDTVHVQRETFLEHELSLVKPFRCGWRCDAVTGEAIVLGVTHLAEGAKAVAWVFSHLRLRAVLGMPYATSSGKSSARNHRS